MKNEVIVESLEHFGRRWDIVKINESYFARQGRSDTGPYSSIDQAIDFIRAIRP